MKKPNTESKSDAYKYSVYLRVLVNDRFLVIDPAKHAAVAVQAVPLYARVIDLLKTLPKESLPVVKQENKRRQSKRKENGNTGKRSRMRPLSVVSCISNLFVDSGKAKKKVKTGVIKVESDDDSDIATKNGVIKVEEDEEDEDEASQMLVEISNVNKAAEIANTDKAQKVANADKAVARLERFFI